MTPEPRAAQDTRTRWLTLHECAARHGAYRWIEHRLFELTGAWASAPGTPAAARLHLTAASAQHAWHAQLWADRLPVLADLDPDAVTRPAGANLDRLLDGLEPPWRGGPEPAGDGQGAIGFLASHYQVVLPRLLRSYERHGHALSEVADGPSIRTLRFVRLDEDAELEAGVVLLGALVRSSPEPADASGIAASAVLEADGLLGAGDPGAGEPGAGVTTGLMPWDATGDPRSEETPRGAASPPGGGTT